MSHVHARLRTRVAASVLALVALAGAAAPGTASAAVCPTSEAGYPGLGGSAYLTEPTVSFSTISGCYHLEFDLRAGALGVEHCGGLGQTFVTGRDAFELTGVPTGTVVNVLAVLRVDGEILSYGCGGSGCFGILEFHLTSGALTGSSYLLRTMYDAGTEPVHGGVPLLIPVTAGEPFALEYHLLGRRGAGGNHGARGTARLTFSNLPPEAGIVSCQGYSQVPVPALRSSWGRIKTTYR